MSGRSDTYHDNLSLFKDGVVGLGQLGGLLLLLHGWMKISMYGAMSQKFVDPFGIGSPASLALSIFAEAVCSSLIVVGLFTRFAAFVRLD